MVPTENATNLMDCKEIKRNETVLLDSRSLAIRSRKRHATFFGDMKRSGSLKHLVTTGQIEGKTQQGKTA